MKVLVTGATGFLGKYILEELSLYPYQIIASGRNIQIGEKFKEKGIEFIQADISHLEELEKIFRQGVEAVIHAGALSTIWGKWENFYQSNVLGTENILRLCQKYKVQRLVYISSPSIYTRAKDNINIKEFTPKRNNLNYYIRSKLMAEKKIREYSQVPTVILRPRGFIGIGDTSIVPRVLKLSKRIGIPLINGGNQMMDLTCVENVALAIRLALESEIAVGKIYHITNGEPKSFKEIINEFLAEMQIKPRYIYIPKWFLEFLARFLEVSYKKLHIYKEPPLTLYSFYTLCYSQTLNIENAKEDLGYQAKLSLKEGIKKYAEHELKKRKIE